MKLSLFFAASALVLGASLSSAGANPRGLGPSAIQAARLKQRPPANYLAHYLPDDRYKIAGGVWRFVSTDLDTYYHVPQSGNMLRQPASLVIGFANAREAEEAGYVPDPTDGTAARVAAATKTLGVTPAPGLGGQDPQGQRYVVQVTGLLAQAQKDARDFVTKVASTPRPQGQTQLGFVPPEIRRAFNVQLSQRRGIATRLRALRPPARYRKFHTLLMAIFNMGTSSGNAIDKMLSTGDLSAIGNMQEQLPRAVALQRALLQEAARVGINPILLR